MCYVIQPRLQKYNRRTHFPAIGKLVYGTETNKSENLYIYQLIRLSWTFSETNIKLFAIPDL